MFLCVMGSPNLTREDVHVIYYNGTQLLTTVGVDSVRTLGSFLIICSAL